MKRNITLLRLLIVGLFGFAGIQAAISQCNTPPASLVCPAGTSSVSVVYEDFEGGAGIFAADAGGTGGGWTSDAGGTTSANTGPSSDVCPVGTGNYFYHETSGSAVGGVACATATVDLSCFVAGDAVATSLQFNANGGCIGDVEITVTDVAGAVAPLVVPVHTAGNLGDVWNSFDFGMSAFAGANVTMQICHTIPNPCPAGASFNADFAIDDFGVYGCSSAACTIDLTALDQADGVLDGQVTVNNTPGACDGMITVPNPILGSSCVNPLVLGFSDDFDGNVLNPELPSTGVWSFTNTSGQNWSIDAVGGGGGNTAWDGNRLNYDDDAGGFGLVGDATATSPVIDLTGATAAALEFDFMMDAAFGGTVDVEVFDGAAWQNVGTLASTVEPFAVQTLDVTPVITAPGANLAAFQARFTYDDGGNFAWYAAVDNFKVNSDIGSAGASNNSPFAAAAGNASGTYPVGSTPVTFSVLSKFGTEVNATIPFVVVDAESPVLSGCPAASTTFNLLPGECEINISWDITATDNCPVSSSFIGPFCDPSLNPNTNTINCTGGLNTTIQLVDISSATVGDMLSEVCFLVDNTTGAMTINLYCDDGSGTVPFAAGGFTPFATTAYTITTGDTGNGFACAPFAGVTVPANCTSVWVELETPTPFMVGNVDGTCGGTAATGNNTYLVGPACGITTPTLFSGIGFSNDVAVSINTTSLSIPVVPDPAAAADLNQFVSGDLIPIGTHCFQYATPASSGPPAVCSWCYTVAGFPGATQTMSCNDLVQVSLDQDDSDCTQINADVILEGGPHGCYDVDYTLTRADGVTGPATGFPGILSFCCSDLGRDITVKVTDNNTGSSCWGKVRLEDKIAPTLDCTPSAVPCSISDLTPGTIVTAPLQFALADPITLVAAAAGTFEGEIEVTLPQGTTTASALSVDLDITHTWTSDLDIFLVSPAGTVIQLADNGGINDCAQNNILASFNDGAAMTAGDYTAMCNTSAATPGPPYAKEGTFQPVNPFTTFDGENLEGTWILRVVDLAGGDGGFVNTAGLSINATFPVTGPLATDNCSLNAPTFIDLEETGACGGPVSILKRKWTIQDQSGNTTSCIQEITFERPSLGDLDLPSDLLLDCCTDEYPDPGANVVLKDVISIDVNQLNIPGNRTTPPSSTNGAITDGDNVVRYDFDLNQGVSTMRTIKDLNITFNATHNDVRDLTIEVAQVAPNGSIIQSSRRTIYEGEIIYEPGTTTAIDAEYLLCSNSQFPDINVTFDDEGCDIHEQCVDFTPSVAGTYTPYQSLSSFDGVLVNDPSKVLITALAPDPQNPFTVGNDFTILVSDRNNNPNGAPPTDGSAGTINSIDVSYSYNDPTAVAGAFISGRPITNNDKCELSITYEDDVVDVCPTSYKILRTWKIIDWCNSTKVEHEQTVKVMDTMAPLIDAPRTQNVDVDALMVPVYEPAVASTVHGSCVGIVTLPSLDVCFEDCSGVASWTTSIFSADGLELLDSKQGNGGLMNEALVLDLDEGPGDDIPDDAPILITLPDGSRVFVPMIRLETLKEPDALYLARYTVKDSCGNESTADVFIQVVDRVAPVPICREETQLSLTGSPTEQTTICASDLDEGSYDNCSNVHFFMRKMVDENDTDPICNVDFGLGPDPTLTFEILGRDGAGAFTLAEQCKYTSCVEFGCDDIGEDNQVFLLVVDDFVIDFINDYLDVVFPFIDAIVDYNTLPLTVLPGDKVDDELDIFLTGAAAGPAGIRVEPDNDRRNRGKRFFEFYLNEDPNADGLFVLPTAILWEGHYNFCMVNVHIEDKVRPTCVAPADVWINCDELPENVDYDDDAALDALFGEATATDNCNAMLVPTGVTNQLDLCGVGRVIRRWRAEDDFGNRSIGSCQQIIMVQPVTNYCITFPGDFEGNCDNTNAPDDLTFVENGCDLLAVSRDFEDFPAADNGECRKEIVTWKVINWCEYDGISDPTRIQRDLNGDNRIDDGEYCSTGSRLLYTPNPTQINYPSTGYYEYKQHVKIFDDVAPELSYDGAVKFCGGDLDEDPCTGQVDIELDITELCTDKLTTVWGISAFATSYGVADIDGSGSISLRLPLGTHTARFSVTDDCGNTSQLDITFSVVDCKAPTPVCHNGLSIDVMPLSGMVELWASDFDASSFDYCSDFTFRANVIEDQNGDGIITSDDYVTVLPPDDFIILDCDDVSSGLTMVQLWVAEQDGTADDACADNQDNDYCVTFVEVQDNNGVCSSSKVGLGGKIANEDNESVENVSIEVNSSASMMGNVTTDASGDYEFLLPVGGDFTVTPMRNDDITNGVSTFDLVLISKHILNVQLLDSPYKILAADANRSESVSTLDLVAIRKAVLRVSNTFPNNTSWRFVDKDQILNSVNPWSAPIKEVINRNNLSTSDLNASFVAIKVGDVNGDATPNNILGVDDRTFNGNLVFTAAEQSVNAGEQFSVDFVAATNVQGYQFTLDYDEKAVELVDIVDGLATEANNFNVVADKGLIATSWNKDQSTADATMFTLVFRAKADVEVSNIVTVSSEVTAAEAYNNDGDLMGISFEFGGQAQAATFELEQNMPNPFKSETTIGFTLPEASSATITISDVTGKVVKVVRGDYTEGYNTVTLKRSDIGTASGVLSYQLETANNSATKQMIIIE